MSSATPITADIGPLICNARNRTAAIELAMSTMQMAMNTALMRTMGSSCQAAALLLLLLLIRGRER